MSNVHKFLNLIKSETTQKELEWIESVTGGDFEKIPVAFVASVRRISKKQVSVSKLFDSFDILDNPVVIWPLDRLVRVYFILELAERAGTDFEGLMTSLFETAEINEAAALYSALPFLPDPEKWVFRATDAVRSNIGPVFDALAFQNPYPALHFTDSAWNQLVLKCIFNDKPIHLIEGLDRRVNRDLAFSISELAHERWAAGRRVPAQAWRLVSKFTDDRVMEDMETLFASENFEDQYAAALVCHDSISKKAGKLLSMYPSLSVSVKRGEISWKILEN